MTNLTRLCSEDITFLQRVCNKPYLAFSREEQQHYQQCINYARIDHKCLYYMIENALFHAKDKSLFKQLLLDIKDINLNDIERTLTLLNRPEIRYRLNISQNEHTNYIYQIFNAGAAEAVIKHNYFQFTDEQIINQCISNQNLATILCTWSLFPIRLKKLILDQMPISLYANIFKYLLPDDDFMDYVFNAMLKNYTPEYISQNLHNFCDIFSGDEIQQLYNQFHNELFQLPQKDILLYIIFGDFLSSDEKQQMLSIIYSDSISLSADTIGFIIHSINWNGIDITRLQAIYSLLELKDDPYPFLH